MAITRQKKETQLAKYSQDYKKSSALFLTRYQGLSVNQLTGLRKKLRDANGSYTVVKNTLAKKILAEAGITGLDDLLQGPVGIGFAFGDPPPVAKILVEFAKETKVMEIKGGLVGNSVVNSASVQDLADLPPLEVLRARLLGVLTAPASQLAGVVAGGVRQIVNVVHAYADSGEETSVAA